MKRTTTTTPTNTTGSSRRRHRGRRSALVVATAMGLASLSGCHLAVTETGLRFVCDGYDYRYVEGPMGGAYVPINELVGAFCPGYSLP